METNKILSALCYFSIFFAPIILPIVVWIVGDEESKRHAQKAFWSHIIPVLTVILAFFVVSVVGFTQFLQSDQEIAFVITMMVAGFICFLVSVFYFIWNIVQGVKILSAK